MTSQTTTLLNSIWSGDTKPAAKDRASKLQALVGRLFPIRSIVLSVPEGPLSGRVFTDEVELLPSLPLGDLIAEEFGIDVPAGTIFICCSEAALSPQCSEKTRSEILGRICADIVLDTVLLGPYRIEAESDAYHHLAEAALRAAYCVHAKTGEIRPALFGIALSQRLDACLRGHGRRESADDSHVRHMRRLLASGISRPTILAEFGEGRDGYDMDSWTSAVAATLHALVPGLKPMQFGDGCEANRSSV